MLKPGSTIGILGGGQLGRMLALAAARLGLHCHVYSPEKDSGAFEIAKAHTCAPYEDEAALAKFAAAVDVITYEFENIPSSTALILSARRPVLPDPKVLETTQDRLAEKDFVTSLGIATARYADVSSAQDLKAAMAHTRKSMDPVFGHVFIYEHCLPFDVSRAYDEASGIKHPRIWTAERDKEMWQALQG